jgi:D-glycero-alpha-D-manno-heptose 1-phosphate guanylyltransferase
MASPTALPRPLAGFDVAVLVGGLGTRLGAHAAGLPKPLVPVLGRPFLAYLLDELVVAGARSLVLCSGFRADLVRDRIGDNWRGVPVLHSVEPSPLGTGGALALARAKLNSPRVVVLNGDTWLSLDWEKLVRDAGPATLTAVSVADPARYGRLELTAAGRVTGFLEKADAAGGAARINGGVYSLSRPLLDELSLGAHSLERDVLPRWAGEGRLRAIGTEGAFLDIGVPAALAGAGDFLRGLGRAPRA